MTDSVASDINTVRKHVELIKKGDLTSEKLVKGHLKMVDTTESEVKAWEHLDRDGILEQAGKMDEIRRKGQPLGDLHGIPVGLKDIVDTAEFPTERGSSIYAGRQPEADAAIVEKLREAGAVVMGKTKTTEFAWMHPTDTRNPHNSSYSPGGSSSGSAAAVAAGQVSLSIGSQTNGSTIRPASYCGIYGFKPTRGIISRRGVLQTSETLDQIGVFGRDLGDMALLCDVLSGYDAADIMSYLAPRPRMLEGFLSEVPVEPNFVWFDLPYADRFSQDVHDGFEELLDAMGEQVDRVSAPAFFPTLLESHKVIHEYEVFQNLKTERENQWDQLSSTTQLGLKSAEAHTVDHYHGALEDMESASKWFWQLFNDYDAVITPSAIGEAPKFGEGTGDPVCCTIWTLCGLPCVSLPILTGTNGLPIGVQLVAGENEDGRLLRTTRWLLNSLRTADQEPEK